MKFTLDIDKLDDINYEIFHNFVSLYTPMNKLPYVPFHCISKAKEFEIDFTDWHPIITFYDEEIAFLFILTCSNIIKQ